MRVIVVGYGVQGRKRANIAGPELAAVVDPVADGARYRRIEDVPPDSYDAALVCTPDEPKLALLDYLLRHGKHALVEKPLLVGRSSEILRLRDLAQERRGGCYTADKPPLAPPIFPPHQPPASTPPGGALAAAVFFRPGTARHVRHPAGGRNRRARA